MKISDIFEKQWAKDLEARGVFDEKECGAFLMSGITGDITCGNPIPCRTHFDGWDKSVDKSEK